MCTTDQDGNQLASFYPGAMTEASEIDIADVVRRPDGVDLVHVGADTPEAMLRHTATARERGLPFAADPSQQLARLDGPQIRSLVTGARFLFTNEYEHALLLSKTGWTGQQVLDQVGTWVTTLGEKGCRIETSGEPPIEVAAVPTRLTADPTGVGDAFRAGFLAATVRGLGPVDAARVGSALATTVLESVGPQTYQVDRELLETRITAAYGAGAGAAEVVTALLGPAR
jgi:adenosine kinase